MDTKTIKTNDTNQHFFSMGIAIPGNGVELLKRIMSYGYEIKDIARLLKVDESVLKSILNNNHCPFNIDYSLIIFYIKELKEINYKKYKC